MIFVCKSNCLNSSYNHFYLCQWEPGYLWTHPYHAIKINIVEMVPKNLIGFVFHFISVHFIFIGSPLVNISQTWILPPEKINHFKSMFLFFCFFFFYRGSMDLYSLLSEAIRLDGASIEQYWTDVVPSIRKPVAPFQLNLSLNKFNKSAISMLTSNEGLTIFNFCIRLTSPWLINDYWLSD